MRRGMRREGPENLRDLQPVIEATIVLTVDADIRAEAILRSEIRQGSSIRYRVESYDQGETTRRQANRSREQIVHRPADFPVIGSSRNVVEWNGIGRGVEQFQ